ncbi:MAG TPA: Uma2 family endonuclease [Tepidisphaeraceae bacterium]|nr:Uma2 family endonuclease [Tepidisphaeraceae bacterium]
MAVPVEKKKYTVREYLERERRSLEKHEYHDGEILMMAGGTRNHSLIIANMIRETGLSLKGTPCRVYDSNLRIRIHGAAFYTYPDVSVVCGEPHLDTDDSFGETVTNPRLIVEVISPTSEGYDRGRKFDQYRMIESLYEYVLVWQDTARVEAFFRQGGGSWMFTPISGLDKSIKLQSLKIELPLGEIYDGVEFPVASDSTPPAAENSAGAAPPPDRIPPNS